MSHAPAPPADARDVSRPESPYVGLVPYGEGDAKFFFGRSAEAAIVAANLRASRLTILYGPSGVGKSSLLMAGVVSDLREEAPMAAADESPFAVCAFRSWCDDPLPALVETMRETCVEVLGGEELPAWQPGEPLVEAVRAWTGRTGTLLVVLDQFEEYFQYHSYESGEERLTGFADELARIVNDTGLPVNILLSIREDAWAKLDRFEGHIPALFTNYLRVDHLDRDAAREAIEGPIVAWNNTLVEGEPPFEIEPALVEAVLAATAVGGLTLTGDSESPPAEAPGDRVEAPFLQLVLDRLWRGAIAAGERTLTLARLEALGGARRIVENHLLDALGRLTPKEQDIASDCARFLVSRSKTKVAYTGSDLAEWTGRPEAQVTAVLDKLCSGESGRILRAIAPAQDGGSTSYELFHDILAEPILAWRRGYEQERAHRLAIRRFVRIGGVLLSLVAVFAALGIWALVKRSDAISATNDAKRAANRATSLALASAAGEQLASHFDVSLLLGLEAYRLSLRAQSVDGSVQAASTVISALEAARRSGAQAILRGHQGRVNGVAISPDGRMLASAGDDGTLRLWDRRTHEQLGRLGGHQGFVYGVAFSPDGRTLASGDDGTVRLWDSRTHERLGRLSGRQGSVLGVAFSPDGRMLASAGDDGTVRLWDSRTHERLGRLSGHQGSVLGVAFSPDGRTLASAGLDGTVWIWSIRTHKSLGRLSGRQGYVYGVAFSPNGRTLASAGLDGTVRLWDTRTHESLGRLTGHKGYVDGVAFSPDGQTLVSAGYDGTVRLWDRRTLQPLRLLTGHRGSVNGVAISPDGQTLASAGEDGTVRLWDRRTDKLLGHPLNGRQGLADGMALSRDGQTLAAAGRDGTVRLWNIRTHKPLGQPLEGRQGSVNGVAFSRDGQTLAVAGEDGTVWLWNSRTHKRLGLLNGGKDPVDGVTFSPDGPTLAAIGHNETVRLWNTRTHKPLGHPLDGRQGYVYGVAFSPDGQTLATAGENKTVWLWDLRTHKRRGQPLKLQDSVYGVAFSPDGQTLASAGRDGTVLLWDIRTLRPLGQPLDGRQGSVKGVAFSPDGRMLASGGFDGTIRLWDISTLRPLGQPLRGHSGPVYGVAFSRDGRTLASGGDDGTVRLWEGILWRDWPDLRDEVCSLFFGNPTKAEWPELAPVLPYVTTCSYY